MLDKHAILEAADILVVVEELGIPFRHTGSNRIQILCPCHDDHNFGSCYLDTKKNTFKCYACGAYGDVFALVQAAQNVSFGTAKLFVANICGGAKLFEMNGSESKKQQYTDARIIPAADRAFIGLYSNTVYRDVDFRPQKSDIDDSEHYFEEAAVGQYVDGYRIMERVESNPLHTMFREDPVTYHKLIDDFCKRTIERYQGVIRLYKQKDIPDKDMRKAISILRNTISYHEWVETITPLIKRAQEISKKHGYGEAVVKEQSAESELIVQLVNDAWANDKEAPF